MREIQITKGRVAIVDDDDYDRLTAVKWHASGIYASNARLGLMHRLVIGAPKGVMVDHINRNGLDNRKENLRLASNSQNQCNRLATSGGRSKYKGVHWCKDNKAWLVRSGVNGRVHYVGLFRDEIAAAKAYNDAVRSLHGEFAVINQIDGYTDGAPTARAAKAPGCYRRTDGKVAYHGVSTDPSRDGQYNAQIKRGEVKRSKRFIDMHAAATWYNINAAELFGESAVINIIPDEFAHYESIIRSDEMSFTPKHDVASRVRGVFRNGGRWMVRFKKDGKTIFQKNFKTECEASEAALLFLSQHR